MGKEFGFSEAGLRGALDIALPPARLIFDPDLSSAEVAGERVREFQWRMRASWFSEITGELVVTSNGVAVTPAVPDSQDWRGPAEGWMTNLLRVRVRTTGVAPVGQVAWEQGIEFGEQRWGA